VIRRALNVAVKWQLITTNPATLVDSPQAGQHEITPLSADEARRLIRAAHGDRMAARWLVGLALGLRQGEALGLWWDDIDLHTGLLRVRQSLQRQHGGGLVFTEPKTHRSKRTIPLPAPLVKALRQHLVDQEKERIAAGSLWLGSTCVHHADRDARRSAQRLPPVQEAAPVAARVAARSCRQYPPEIAWHAVSWVFAGEVFTFRPDLGKRALIWGSPTG
jgi:integrase